MTRSQRKHNKQRGFNKLIGASAMCAVSGVVILLLPLFFTSAMLRPVALGLRSYGWPLIAVAIALLGIYFVFKRVIGVSELNDRAPDQKVKSALKQALATPQIKQTAPMTGIALPDASPRVPKPASTWSADVFTAIEWRRFEAVCEALFAQAGFSTRSQSHGADGGVDIWLHSANAHGPVGVVQCKHWQGKPVGVKEMREFFGVMASHQLKRGTYATTSTYTADAKQFAKDNSINALDGPALLALIAQRTPEQQQALLAIAYEGDYWRPTCASCGTKMVERTPAKGGAGFWGCAGFPKCRRTLQMAG